MVQLVGSVLEAVSSTVCSGFFIEAKTERPKIDSRGGVLVDGKEVASPSPSARVYGEHCELLQWGSRWSPDHPKVFHYFQHSQ